MPLILVWRLGAIPIKDLRLLLVLNALDPRSYGSTSPTVDYLLYSSFEQPTSKRINTNKQEDLLLKNTGSVAVQLCSSVACVSAWQGLRFPWNAAADLPVSASLRRLRGHANPVRDHPVRVRMR